MQTIYRFYQRVSSEKGVISIEFSFIFIIFVAFVFIIFEISKLIFVITAIDYSLAEAARNSAYKSASQQAVSYQKRFEEVFYAQNKFWDFFINPDDLEFTVKFCTNISELTSNRCTTTIDRKRRLAMFTVAYHYRPLKIVSEAKWSENLFSSLNQKLNRKVTYLIESSS